MIARMALLTGLVAASPLAALDFVLPSTARVTVVRDTDPDRYAAPVGVFAEGKLPTVAVDGTVARSVWRIEASGLTPLQVMRPLRDQIERAGYDVVLDCSAQECGGYDFRFATETLPGPNMYVNIRAFQFVTGIMGPEDAPERVVTVLASSSSSSSHVQIIQAEATRAPETPPPERESEDDFADVFLGQGHIILQGLEFETGTSELGRGPFSRLEALAALLADRPSLTIALVGHTDTIGGLEANIALSRQRAQAVRGRLIEVHGIDPERIDAEGMGYLAPVASNLNAEGREANRRVEAIVLRE